MTPAMIRSDVQSFGANAHTQGFGYLENGGKTGVAFSGKGFVAAFPAHAGVMGQPGHAARAGNGTQRPGDEGRVIPRLFKTGVEISRDVCFFAGYPNPRKSKKTIFL